MVPEVMSPRKGSRVFDELIGAFASVMHRRRRRHRQEVRLTAEVLIRMIRKVLFQATSIALALDESKYRKIIRVRAFRPRVESSCSRWRHVGASGVR